MYIHFLLTGFWEQSWRVGVQRSKEVQHCICLVRPGFDYRTVHAKGELTSGSALCHKTCASYVFMIFLDWRKVWSECLFALRVRIEFTAVFYFHGCCLQWDEKWSAFWVAVFWWLSFWHQQWSSLIDMLLNGELVFLTKAWRLMQERL